MIIYILEGKEVCDSECSRFMEPVDFVKRAIMDNLERSHRVYTLDMREDKEGKTVTLFEKKPRENQFYLKDAIFKVRFPRHIFAEGPSYCSAVKMVTNKTKSPIPVKTVYFDGDEIPKEHFVWYYVTVNSSPIAHER